MKSNYKRLGPYIRQVDIRNKDDKRDNLLGVSVTKEFIKSIANTVGTDFTKYKVVKKNQFTYIPDTSRRGDKIAVALLEKEEEGLVSQAYTVFEVTDSDRLLPEYLMMWFRRPEFDRYARFISHGSVREIFSWEDLCEIKLPIPSIKMQEETVNQYNVIQDRINQNNIIIRKTEETAHAIYKQWFVDFEFPNENGEPYKSSGGEMEFIDGLDMEIPKGWRVGTIGEILTPKGYIRGPFGSALKKDEMVELGVPVYEQQHAIYNHREFRYFITEEKYKSLKRFAVKKDDFVISCSGTLGKVTVIKEDDPIGIINQALLILRVDPNKLAPICFKYFITSKEGNAKLIADAGGSAQVNIAKREEVESIPIVIPDLKQQNIVSKLLSTCDYYINIKLKENDLLEKSKEIFLTKVTTVGG
ncbi:restriction endonuclease subunit S [Bacillus sp. Marseille-P3661]|uniref:restriction endonuclease subunit S n=2 Tax=Bacillaceae TaxID=186817 RepID=UPI000C83D597|nr:restriction endonuclease subunit S [Bacillus sp. Marseille-P3661]